MRILVCSHWMEIGGAERALLGLLYSIDYSIHQVDLFLCRHSGEFMSLIPEKVNLLPEDPKAADIAKPITEVIKRGHFDIALGRVVGKVLTKQYDKRNKLDNSIVAIENSNRFTYPFLRRINPGVQYDFMLSFTEPHYIAIHKADAKRTIAWMHTDYAAIGLNAKEGLRVWGLYDSIAAISQSCFDSFSKVYPSLKDKLIIIENINHPELIKKQSEEFDVSTEMNGEIKLLSVGRFSEAKNFDNIPDICVRIRKAGYNIKWYLIGYGGDEELIRRRIKEANAEQYVHILGKKSNPYPYIAACDLYVHPSRYEGKSVSVREAQILGKPVVITNYPTSASQLNDGVDGIIVPMDNEGCAEGICKLLSDPHTLNLISKNCQSTNYANPSELNKLFSMDGYISTEKDK